MVMRRNGSVVPFLLRIGLSLVEANLRGLGVWVGFMPPPCSALGLCGDWQSTPVCLWTEPFTVPRHTLIQGSSRPYERARPTAEILSVTYYFPSASVGLRCPCQISQLAPPGISAPRLCPALKEISLLHRYYPGPGVLKRFFAAFSSSSRLWIGVLFPVPRPYTSLGTNFFFFFFLFLVVTVAPNCPAASPPPPTFPSSNSRFSPPSLLMVTQSYVKSLPPLCYLLPSAFILISFLP